MTSPKRYIPIDELISLARRRAVVTGGAMGIGFAISRRLAEAGATVLIADTNHEQARDAVQKLRDFGYQASFVPCDVSREDDVRDMVDAAVKAMGGIDILVNNAGIYPRIPLSQMTGGDFERVIAVNLSGTFLCSREVSQQMIAQGADGCIINIASIDSLHPSAKELSAYDASKGGVLMLTRSLALELAQYGIRVNAIAPGGVLTGGALSAMSDSPTGAGKSQLKTFMARMALGRMGSADDIGRVALFLASDLASYMTGSLVVVDGGYLLS